MEMAGARLLPHRMSGRAASIPATGWPPRVRTAPHEFYDGSAWNVSGAPASTAAAVETPGAEDGLVLMPHEMSGRAASIPATGWPPRVRTAPHEFYDGSAWNVSGTPASTTAAMETPGAEDGLVLMPHEMFGRAAAETETGGRPRHVRAAPHEFFDGSAWAFQGGAGGGGGFGAAPASARAVVGLPQATVATADGGGDRGECAVCLEELVAGDTLRTLPCAHGFHEGCIVDWLAVSHLCPLCRFKMPTQAEEDAAAAAAGRRAARLR